MARLHLRARFGLALAAVTFSIAGRTYKMADPCILLWFIYLFSLKKRKRRKYRIKLVVHDIDARLAEFHAVFGKKPYNDKNPVWSNDLSPF